EGDAVTRRGIERGAAELGIAEMRDDEHDAAAARSDAPDLRFVHYLESRLVDAVDPGAEGIDRVAGEAQRVAQPVEPAGLAALARRAIGAAQEDVRCAALLAPGEVEIERDRQHRRHAAPAAGDAIGRRQQPQAPIGAALADARPMTRHIGPEPRLSPPADA